MEIGTQRVEQSQHLTFLIAEEEYAVGILRVREIIQFETITRVPKTPRWIRGVINLRGSIVPVVDLAVKFGLSETRVTNATCIVITEVEIAGEQTVMGLLADAVSQVIELGADQIEPPPAFGATVRADYLLGMGRVGKKLVLMLDVDKVLAADELLAAADVVAAETASGDVTAGVAPPDAGEEEAAEEKRG
jgi:purine-binding chemotaxis protein CheW